MLFKFLVKLYLRRREAGRQGGRHPLMLFKFLVRFYLRRRGAGRKIVINVVPVYG